MTIKLPSSNITHHWLCENAQAFVCALFFASLIYMWYIVWCFLNSFQFYIFFFQINFIPEWLCVVVIVVVVVVSVCVRLSRSDLLKLKHKPVFIVLHRRTFEKHLKQLLPAYWILRWIFMWYFNWYKSSKLSRHGSPLFSYSHSWIILHSLK